MDPAKGNAMFDYFNWLEESASGLRTLDSDSDGEISMVEFLSYVVRQSYCTVHSFSFIGCYNCIDQPSRVQYNTCSTYMTLCMYVHHEYIHIHVVLYIKSREMMTSICL